MATWNRIGLLPSPYQNQIVSFYRQYNFPIEIRSRMAGWLDQQTWTMMDPTFINANCELAEENLSQIDVILGSLVEQTTTLIQQTSEIPLNYQLHQFLQELNSSNCLDLVKAIIECLKFEQIILQRAAHGVSEEEDLFEVNLSQAKDKINQAELLYRKIKAIVEDLNIKSAELNSLNQYQNQTAMLQQNQLQQVETKKANLLNDMKNRIWPQYSQIREEWLDLYLVVINDLENIFTGSVLVHLNAWKQRQQHFETESYDNIVQVKEMCDRLTVQIRNVLLRIKNVETLMAGGCFKDKIAVDKLKVIKAKVIELLKTLVNETFVIKLQPRQVIKKDTKFLASLTMLISGVLHVPMSPPVVKVSIINETQAKRLYLDRDCPDVESCGEILNCTCVMEVQDASRSLTANFVNLQLKRIKRNEKKGTESVMDEKFGLLFTTEFFIDNDLKIRARALSVPVVVIVHGNQDANAQATITWDNAFAAATRCPFEVPQEVCFQLLARVLSQKFFEAAGRPLSEENIRYLACKLLGNFEHPDPLNASVSWPRFCKEHLPGQSFTFWDWFYAIFKLTRDHLPDLWRDGFIIGFLTRQRAEELLKEKSPGTFLLRFSDTKLGGISVASVTFKDTEYNREIYMVDPYMAKDLMIRKLADRLHDIEELTYLYPDKPKNDAFGQYYTRENQVRNGYVRPLLRNYLPFLSSNEGNSQAVTPNSSQILAVGGQTGVALTPNSVNSAMEGMPMSNEYMDYENLFDNSEDNIIDFNREFNN